MLDIKSSYTAANEFPLKLALHRDAIDEHGYIRPIHAQIMPTNACNLACPFCSCRDESKAQRIGESAMAKLLADLRDLGCEAVTITGGGEPLLYAHLDLMLRWCGNLGISSGLVTNGTMLGRVELVHLGLIQWCRISAADDRATDFDWLRDFVADYPNVDWAFSYVVSSNPNLEAIVEHVEFADLHGFTHVRVVPDLFMSGDEMERVLGMVRSVLHLRSCPPVYIVQDRSKFTGGSANCQISLLKPVIGADGWVYPCCGVQYQNPGYREMLADFRLCRMEDIKSYWAHQHVFDGAACKVCYYGQYNRLLGEIPGVTHRKFL